MCFFSSLARNWMGGMAVLVVLCVEFASFADAVK